MKLTPTGSVTGDIALTKNDRHILGLLFRRKVLTQMAIAQETGLTQQSVSRIIAGFMQSGLVQAGERISAGKRGYPSTSVMLSPDYAFSAGVSIEADAISLVVLDFSGALICERRLPMFSLPIKRVLDWASDTLEELQEALSIPRKKMAGIGIAIAGSFMEGGGFNTSSRLEEWAGIDVAKLFSDHFGLPAFADNDGNAAAVAEGILGVGRWADSFAYLYIAAGVGGGLILDGELWRGKFGNAGEFAGGLPTNIYPFPNLELLRLLVAREGKQFQNVDEMVANFDLSWSAIDDWIARVKDSLSIIASNATAILDLDAIVLGGRIPRDLALRIIPSIELYDQKRRSVGRPMAKIVAAEATGEITAIGAALLPLKNGFLDS